MNIDAVTGPPREKVGRTAIQKNAHNSSVRYGGICGPVAPTVVASAANREAFAMSLSKFVEMPDVAARLKPLRPQGARKIDALIKVEPQSARYMLVGTAFDYLLRFELQRRAPHAVSGPWMAETASKMIVRNIGSASVGLDLLHDADPARYLPPEEVANRAAALVENAKSSVATYLKEKNPSKSAQGEMAGHALRLAKLDSIYRRQTLDLSFEDVDKGDISELVALLQIVPFDQLTHDKVLLLNPDFGQISKLVQGADADLISGDLLVDFKVVRTAKLDSRMLDQLLGYYLLARKEQTADPQFPPIGRVGIYFARHGFLWSIETSEWISRPEFSEVEQWFFERAAQLFKTRPAARRG